MSDDLDVGIKLTADASGVEAGVAKSKRSLKDLSDTAKRTGKEAGAGVGGFGDGADAAAKKVDAATRNMQGSIQRLIAEQTAGSKSSREYYEALAATRGINAQALKPYLDQLDQAKAKTLSAENATRNWKDSLVSIGPTLPTLFLAAAAGSVAYTKSVLNGIDALNDLKDATGASIENISALEDVALRTGTSFETVSTSLVKFNQALSASKPGSDTEKAIKSIGLSVKELKELDPAVALQQVARALAGYDDDAKKARLTQELFGKSLKEVAPLLKDLADVGALNATVTTQQAEAAEAFNKQLFALQKNSTDTARSFASELLPTLTAVATEFTAAGTSGSSMASLLAGGVKNAIEATTILFANTSFVLKGVGREIGALAAQYVAFMTLDFEGFNAISDAVKEDGVIARKELDDLERRILGLGTLNSAAGAGRGSVNPAAVSVSRPSVGDFDGGATKEQIAAANRELKEQAKVLAELNGFSASFAEDWARLDALFKNGKISLKGLNDAQEALRAKQPGIKAAADKQISDMKAAYQVTLDFQEEINQAYVADSKAREKARLAVDDYVKTIDEQNQLTQLELSLMTATTQSRDKAIAYYQIELDLKRQIAAIDNANNGFDEAQREEQRAKARAAAAQARITADNRVLIKEGQKLAETLETGVTDALMRGFESGKGPLENLVDTARNMFSTLVLRPRVQAVVEGGLNALGFGGSGGGLMSSLSSAYSAYQASGSVQAGFASLFGGGTSAALSGYGTTAATGYGASSVIAGGNLGVGAGAGAGSSAAGGASAGLAAIPVAGWIAMGMLASSDAYDNGFRANSNFDNPVKAILDPNTSINLIDGALQSLGVDGKTAAILSGSALGAQLADFFSGGGEYVKSAGDANVTFDKDGNRATTKTAAQINTNGLGRTTAEADKLVQGLQDQYLALAKSLRIGTVATEFSYGSNNSDGGKFQLGGGATGRYGVNQTETKTTPEALELAASRAVFAALKGSDLPKYLSGVFDNIDVGSTSLADINAVLEGAQKLSVFNSALLALPFSSLADQSYQATQRMLALGGGIDTFATNLGGYFTNYYSPEEQRKQAVGNIVRTANAAGGNLTEDGVAGMSRADYRKLVEKTQAQFGADSPFYVALIGLNGAFASITPTMEEAARAAETANQAVIDSNTRLLEQGRDYISSVQSLISGISSSVDTSIFQMQYGLADNQGKYNMLDVRGSTLDQQLRSATDINDIAKYADQQIALINQGFGLLNVDQQKASILEFETRLNAIDDFVKSKGADAISIQQAKDDKTAATIAAAVGKSVSESLTGPAAELTAAAAAIAAAAEVPVQANVSLSVQQAPGVEVSIR